MESSKDGFVSGIDPLELGMVSVSLGAGREKVDDVIDTKAGIILKKNVGDSLAVFYTDHENVLSPTRERIAKAFKFSSIKPERKPMILDIVDKNGARKWNKI